MKVPRSRSNFIMSCFYLTEEFGGETVLYFQSGEDAITVTFEGYYEGGVDSMQAVVAWFQDDGWGDLLDWLHDDA